MIANLKAALLVLAFILSISVPAMAVETHDESNLKKLESARMIKEKASEGEEISPAGASLAGNSEFSIIRLFQGLGVCIAAFLIGIHFYKKFILKDKPSGARSLKVRERITLSQKSQLCVVEYNGKPLLLAVGSENVSFYQDSEILTSLGNYTDLPEMEQAKELCEEKVN